MEIFYKRGDLYPSTVNDFWHNPIWQFYCSVVFQPGMSSLWWSCDIISWKSFPSHNYESSFQTFQQGTFYLNNPDPISNPSDGYNDAAAKKKRNNSMKWWIQQPDTYYRRKAILICDNLRFVLPYSVLTMNMHNEIWRHLVIPWSCPRPSNLTTGLKTC